MIESLAYISLIAGAVLLILLLLSIFAGDTDVSDTDTSLDGGFGLIKSGLTFLAVGAWVLRYLLLLGYSTILAAFSALISGIVVVFILGYVFRLLLKNQKNVNWSATDAIGKKAKVYLRILPGHQGLVMVEINGVERELPATSDVDTEITTGEEVLVLDEKEEVLLVVPAR